MCRYTTDGPFLLEETVKCTIIITVTVQFKVLYTLFRVLRTRARTRTIINTDFCMFTSCHVFTNMEYLYRQTAAALAGIISYTYHLRTMNYIVFTRSNQAQYHLKATSAPKMTTKSKRPMTESAIANVVHYNRRNSRLRSKIVVM